MNVIKKYLVPILCLSPIVVFLLWNLSGRNSGSFLSFGIILACPLFHIFLMKHDGKNECKHNEQKEVSKNET